MGVTMSILASFPHDACGVQASGRQQEETPDVKVADARGKCGRACTLRVGRGGPFLEFIEKRLSSALSEVVRQDEGSLTSIRSHLLKAELCAPTVRSNGS